MLSCYILLHDIDNTLHYTIGTADRHRRQRQAVADEARDLHRGLPALRDRPLPRLRRRAAAGGPEGTTTTTTTTTTIFHDSHTANNTTNKHSNINLNINVNYAVIDTNGSTTTEGPLHAGRETADEFSLHRRPRRGRG